MAISTVTPRDKLQRLVDLAQKTTRYWWLVAIFAIVGGTVSLGFAMLRPKKYQSWATLFYQERIQTQLLTPTREEIAQRNIGDKYRELLLARAQLEKIVTDPTVNPYPKVKDKDLAIDMLRNAAKLEVRGGNVFRINFTDDDPERAKLVTERLTKMLQERDEQLRNEQAKATVEFALQQKDEASKELRKVEQSLAEFLAKHPEFAADPNQTSEGAGIRQLKKNTPAPAGNTRLAQLERQKQRIQAALDAPADTPVKIAAPPTAEKLAADRAVDAAEQEVANAKRALEDANTKFTAKHPTVIAAQERLNTAQQRLRQAQANVPPDVIVSPATPEKREKMKEQLADVDRQIAALQKTKDNAASSPAVDNATNWIVQLETEHADLRRAVNEQRERVDSLADSVFRAQMDANQKAAEAGGRLAPIDPAFRPIKPSGPGKTVFLMAGMALFLGLGMAVAILLAVIDDRLYRRADIDQLGIAVLAVIPPATARMRKKR